MNGYRWDRITINGKQRLRIHDSCGGINMADLFDATAIREIERLRRIVRRVTEAQCTCGGAGPGEGCEWCEIYHEAMATEVKHG